MYASLSGSSNGTRQALATAHNYSSKLLVTLGSVVEAKLENLGPDCFGLRFVG